MSWEDYKNKKKQNNAVNYINAVDSWSQYKEQKRIAEEQQRLKNEQKLKDEQRRIEEEKANKISAISKNNTNSKGFNNSRLQNNSLDTSKFNTNIKSEIYNADNLAKKLNISVEDAQKGIEKSNSLPSKIKQSYRNKFGDKGFAGIDAMINEIKKTPENLNAIRETSVESPIAMGLRGGIAGVVDSVASEGASLFDTPKDEKWYEQNSVAKQLKTYKKVYDKAQKISQNGGNTFDVIWGAGSTLATDTAKNAMGTFPISKTINNLKKGTQKVLENTIDKNTREEIQRKLLGATDSYYQDHARYQEIEAKKSPAKQYMDNVLESTSRMGVSLGASFATGNPEMGLIATGLSAKGSATQEALKDGATLEEAIDVGNLSGLVEMATEKLWSGIKLPGGKKLYGDALGDSIESFILNKLKTKGGKWLASKGMDVVGEIVEEFISDTLGSVAKQGIYDDDEKLPTAKDYLNTATTTAGTTLLLNLLTGGIFQGANTQNINKKSTYYDYYTGKKADNSTQNILNEAENIIKRNNMPNLEQNNVKNQNNNQQQQINQIQNKNVLNSNIEGQNNYINSAQKYNIDTNNQSVRKIGELANKRGINIAYDDSLFKNNTSANAIYQTTTDKNGNVTRNIILNPNANTNRTLEQIELHEIVHDMYGTEQFNKIKDMVLEYDKGKDGYQEARAGLEELYSQVYDKNSSEFQSLVDEEAVADILGNKLGDQQFVNELVTMKESRSIARKIYDWVVEKLNNMTRKFENMNSYFYWKDVKNKFEEAFRQEYQGNNSDTQNTRYFIETVASFDEIEYNRVKQIKLPSQEYAILSGIVNSDSNIKPGLNYVETTNATYEVYFKETGEFKVTGKYISGGQNDNSSRRNLSRTNETGNVRSWEQINSEQVSNGRTGTRNDEVLNINKGQKSNTNRSRNGVNENSSNVKYSMQESENNSGSFNLPKSAWQNRLDTLYKNENKGTRLQDIKLPTKENMQQNTERINNYNGYTEKEMNNLESGKIQIALSDSDIQNFAKKALDVPGNFKMYVSKIKNSVSAKIKSQLGINVEGYNISLKNDAIRHTIAQHSDMFKENLRGQVPITVEDFKNIPEIINNPDNIEYAGKTKQGKPVIRFEKNINGNNVVISYVSDKHKNLEFQTMDKYKKDSAITSNVSNTLNRTSETDNGTNPFINNSIPQNEKNATKNSTNSMFELTNEQKEKIKQLKEQNRQYAENKKRMLNKQEAGKFIKGYAMQISAEIRKIVQGDLLINVEGGLTENELNKKIEHLRSNYVGKEVYVDGNKATIVSNAFGNIKVEFEDGTYQTVEKEQIKPVVDIDNLIKEQEQQYQEYLKEKSINHIPQNENNVKNNKIQVKNVIEQQELPMTEEVEQKRIARILTEPVGKVKPKDRTWAIFKANILDKGIVFEELSRKADKAEGKPDANRELQGKWDFILSSQARGQNAIGEARHEYDPKTKTRKQIAKSLEDIKTEVGDNRQEFYDYMYHQLNIDRMTLEQRYNSKNKPVFGDSVTAEISQEKVAEYEKKYPEFKEWAQDVYDYNNANKQELVKSGVISQETADFFNEMYPHYVPIKRVDKDGNAIKVPLETNRTGINSPIAKAKGGNSDIQPLFETMAERTLQTYRASARNSFGVELKNVLNKLNQLQQNQESNINVDDIVETLGDKTNADELLQKAKDGRNPTFTVFENGNKITFDVSMDMYDALKPLSDSSLLSKTIKPLNKISNFKRSILTEYNPFFLIGNAIKDFSDIKGSSQHAIKTYAKLPEAYQQISSEGYWYNEYVENGGKANSYFADGKFNSDKKISKTKNMVKEVVIFPFKKISNASNIVEMAPRLAEYIASRESGRSIEVSMLDAARVTTNFKASGDVTKFANRNGATFLNASVQGALQQIRNIQEAHARGIKGYAVLATKLVMMGLPTILLNHLLWGDDDDYEELQDYVKDNYYCIAKFGDGRFIRIPKGRLEATVSKIASTIDNYITDKKEINGENLAKDFWEDLLFAGDNLAPNNPIDENIASPIVQAVTNKSWYGEDIVPSRLQDKPAKEQYDETIDSFSIWLGDKLNISPYKINYILDQSSGGVGDVVLPAMTKQAENNVVEDKFTTDSTMKSKYPGEFYSKIDELKVNSNSSQATDEDILKYKYASSISEEMGKLYNEKRKIQNSDKTDKEKKEQLKEVQEKINKLAKEGLEDIEHFIIKNNTTIIGNNQYYKTINLTTEKEQWENLSEKELEKNKNIKLESYGDYKRKVAKETINQRKNGKIEKNESIDNKSKMMILVNSNYDNIEKTLIYENYIGTQDELYSVVMKNTGININEYLKYKTQKFESDKKDDGTIDGKTINGSQKQKVYKYVNNMKVNYNQRLLLLGTQYKLSTTERQQIANYIKGLNITNTEKIEMYKKMKGFKIYKNGRITY